MAKKNVLFFINVIDLRRNPFFYHLTLSKNKWEPRRQCRELVCSALLVIQKKKWHFKICQRYWSCAGWTLKQKYAVSLFHSLQELTGRPSIYIVYHHIQYCATGGMWTDAAAWALDRSLISWTLAVRGWSCKFHPERPQGSLCKSINLMNVECTIFTRTWNWFFQDKFEICQNFLLLFLFSEGIAARRLFAQGSVSSLFLNLFLPSQITTLRDSWPLWKSSGCDLKKHQ